MTFDRRRVYLHPLCLILLAAVPPLVSPTIASAVPLRWTLDNAVLGNGDTATGSFTFDADTVTYSDVMVSVSGNDYDALFAGTENFGEFAQSGDLPGLSGDGLLSLRFVDPLTNAGGMIDLELGFPSGSGLVGCFDDDCNLRTIAQQTNFVSGSVVAMIVPEPTAMMLLLTAVGSLRLFSLRDALRRVRACTHRGGAGGTVFRPMGWILPSGTGTLREPVPDRPPRRSQCGPA